MNVPNATPANEQAYDAVNAAKGVGATTNTTMNINTTMNQKAASVINEEVLDPKQKKLQHAKNPKQQSIHMQVIQTTQMH